MANYTTELRTIVEYYGNNNEIGNAASINDSIKKALPHIFDDFNIFDDNYREVLETKIIKHFYTREIAYETVPLWRFKLNTKLDEIMPLYNQLYRSELLKFNPFYDIDMYTEHSGKATRDTDDTSNTEDTQLDNRSIDRTHESNTDENRSQNTTDSSTRDGETSRKANETAKGSSSIDSNNQTNNDSRSSDVSRDLYSETPQGGLEGLEDGTYLTNARKTASDNHTITTDNGNTQEHSETANTTDTNATESSKDSTNRIGTLSDSINRGENATESSTDKYESDRQSIKTANQNMRSTEDYLQHVYGKNGGKDYSSLLMEYRKTFVNIDMMVIEELEPLFFGLY